MCVCVYTHTQVYIHTYMRIHTYMCTYTFICLCVNMYTYFIGVYTHTCSYIVLEKKGLFLSISSAKYNLYCSFVLFFLSHIHIYLSIVEIPVHQTCPRCSFYFHFICLVCSKCQSFFILLLGLYSHSFSNPLSYKVKRI